MCSKGIQNQGAKLRADEHTQYREQKLQAKPSNQRSTYLTFVSVEDLLIRLTNQPQCGQFVYEHQNCFGAFAEESISN